MVEEFTIIPFVRVANPTGPKRHHEEHHQNAIDAVESNSTVKVKAHS